MKYNYLSFIVLFLIIILKEPIMQNINNLMYIRNNNLINIVKLLITPYDECNIECPEEMADKISKVLQKCMEKGASIICKQVKISTDINIGKHWIH